MKRALVIGANRGLGKHIASKLSQTGWEVTGTGRRPLNELQSPPNFEYLQADLSDAGSISLLSNQFLYQRPRLIIQNAVNYGATEGEKPSLNEIENIFRVNALLPYRILYEYISSAPDHEFSSCIVINSDSIYHATQQSGVYAASKAALRVLTSALADICQDKYASVSTLLLGPLADEKKMAEFQKIAAQKGCDVQDIIRVFLRKSNPFLVTDDLIDFDSCFKSIQYIASLESVANGMLCKLDGGSSGSLV